MATIRSGVGLVSGLDINGLIDAITTLQRTPLVRMEQRIAQLQSRQTGLSTLEANVIALTTSVQQLGLDSVFKSFTVDNSDTAQLDVTTGDSAVPGTYHYQTIRTASTHSLLSKGYANSDQQTLGTGSLTIATGGGLNQSTQLDLLNGGEGVRRGTIRITDRSGALADIDLADTYTVDDVLAAINASDTISVTASTAGGQLILTDTSGSTASDFSVVDRNGGHAAEDLGIAKSVASATLSGNDVFEVTGDFTLDQINDGNTVRLFNGAPDLRILLTDDTQIEVNLDGAVSLNDVISKINNHEDNTGKVTAALSNGRLTLTDTSGGGGTSPFSVEDVNSSSVVRQLGLDVAAAGTTISGRGVVAGLNSVLLANLRGGQGIDQLGQITLTDRAGVTATLDLSSAESLDEVINAINSAQNGGGTDLQLTARINASGTGIEVEDTSGLAASNLIIADVGPSTLATQLGIAVDAAQTSIDSGRLSLRYVNEATSITNYAPDGAGIDPGSIRITDSAGNSATVEISSAVQNVGDVLQRLNAASGVSIRAELNETGDGFVLIDEAGGAGTLTVDEVDGTTAADLRLSGTAELGTDGKYRISSRFAAVVDIESTDTLDDVVQKINDTIGFAEALVIDDGSAFNSKRLSLASNQSGTAGRLIIDSSGVDFGLNTTSLGQDALLRSGSSVESGFVIASKNNQFDNIASGIDVEALQVGSSIANVTISRDTGKIENTINSFVDTYNNFVDLAANLTKFDLETEERGVLQGDGTVLRVQSRLESMINRKYLTSQESLRSLSQLGVRITTDGKLEFDEAQFNVVVNDDPQGVSNFFLDEEKGFAALAEETINSFTDTFTGTFTLQKDALQTSVDSLSERIEELDDILNLRKQRLLLQFINMENILGSLQSQQSAIAGISPLSVSAAGTGVF